MLERFSRNVFLGVALLAVVSGCGLPSGPHSQTDVGQEIEVLENEPWGEPNVVLAVVNGREITRGEFYVRVLRRFGTWKLLGGLIKEELFLQEAQRLGISVGSDQVGERVDEILRDMATQAGGNEELRSIYLREGLRLEDVRRDLEREVSTQLLVGEVTRAMRKIGDAELREYYRQTYRHRRFLTRHIAYSFLPPPGYPEADPERLKQEARERAERAIARLQEGADFAEIARAESDDPVTAAQGGVLPAVHEEAPMDPAMKAAILSLEEGEILSEPVENPAGGFHVFQVTRILPSQSFADCRETMVREMREREPTEDEIAKALETLRERAEVQVFGSALSAPSRDVSVRSRASEMK